MGPPDLEKLRGFYHSLLEQQQVLTACAQSNEYFLNETTAEITIGEIERLSQEFPGLIPSANWQKMKKFKDRYELSSVRAQLGLVVGRVKAALDKPDSSLVINQRTFPFISDPALRQLVERDFQEIQKAFVTECWKSVIILCGGAIEAILTDLLLQKESIAKASPKAPKAPDKANILDWGLVYLILVSVDLQLISPGVEKLSHSIREYRDLIHPTVEVRSRLQPNAEEARIALEVLNMLYRELSGHGERS